MHRIEPARLKPGVTADRLPGPRPSDAAGEGAPRTIRGKALVFWDEKAKEGRIHGHHEYFALTGNATKRVGTMVVEGELGELLRIQTEDDSLRLQAEASQICENFCVEICEANSEDSINRYVQTLQGMGLS